MGPSILSSLFVSERLGSLEGSWNLAISPLFLSEKLYFPLVWSVISIITLAMERYKSKDNSIMTIAIMKWTTSHESSRQARFCEYEYFLLRSSSWTPKIQRHPRWCLPLWIQFKFVNRRGPRPPFCQNLSVTWRWSFGDMALHKPMRGNGKGDRRNFPTENDRAQVLQSKSVEQY